MITGTGAFDLLDLSKLSESVTIDLARLLLLWSGGNVSVELIEGIVGSPYGDRIFGDAGANRIDGGPGDDILFGGAGDDTLEGGDGTDTVFYLGRPSSFSANRNARGQLTYTSPNDGVDTLRDVERVGFSDNSYRGFDLSPQASCGKAVLLVGALLGIDSLGNTALMGRVIQYFDGSRTLTQACEDLEGSGVLQQLAGGAGSMRLGVMLATNILGIAPSPELTERIANLVDSGLYTASGLVAAAAMLDANQLHVDLTGLTQTGIAYLGN